LKDLDVKEEESARNDLAFSKSFLGRFATLLCNVFDAGGGTIMVMVKLMQRSEVSNITQRKVMGILDDIRTRSRLCNTADAFCDGACAGHLYMLCIFIYQPGVAEKRLVQRFHPRNAFPLRPILFSLRNSAEVCKLA